MAKDKLDLVVDRIDDLKESTEKRLDSIDFNLAEHMQQTMLVREQNAEIRVQNSEIVKQTEYLAKLHADNKEEIEAVREEVNYLKEPKIAMKVFKSIVVYVGAVSGTILGILKVIDHFSK